MSQETLRASVNKSTISDVNTLLLLLNTQADALVSSETGGRIVYSLKVTLTGGDQTSVIFLFKGDHYDDTKAKIDDIIAQVTAGMTAIEDASTYTTVSTIIGYVSFTYTE